MKKLQIFLLLSISMSVLAQAEKKKNPSSFLPNGYVIFEKIYGDLDEDGSADCILVIKGTNKDNIVLNQFGEKVDRNRRGIIILLNRNNHYELVLENIDCFSSENEDGGVYFPPELSIEIREGKLKVHYAHGRYGYWNYTFQYQNLDFELIGYHVSNGGVVIDNEMSINFLSNKKQKRVNTNNNAEGGDEVFEETWENIEVNKLISLSEIKNFYDLDMSVY